MVYYFVGWISYSIIDGIHLFLYIFCFIFNWLNCNNWPMVIMLKGQAWLRRFLEAAWHFCQNLLIFLYRLDFGEAFNLAKKHRISMNLLYDHKPSAFIANVETFITQLKSSGNINLFLTDLV